MPAPPGWDQGKVIYQAPPGWDKAQPETQPTAPAAQVAPPPTQGAPPGWDQAAPKLPLKNEQKPGLNAIKLPEPVQQANEAAQGGFAELQRRGAESVRHPIDAVLNVFGTPQRALAGLKAGVQAGQGLAALGRAAYDAMNPDEGQQDLDDLVKSVEKYMPKTDNPVAQFAEHFGAQMLTDPLTVLPPLAAMKKTLMATKAAQDLYEGAKAVGVALPGVKAAIKVGGKAKQAYHEHLGNELKKVLSQRPELDEHLTTGGKTARIGIEHRNIARIQDELLHGDKALLKRSDAALKNVKPTEGKGYELPEEIRQRYLREAWRYGTPEMRQAAEALHYKPIVEDKPWEAMPENLLDYDLRKDYQYIGDLKKSMADAPAFASHGAKYGQKTANFELRRNGNWDGLEADQRDRVAARLQMGRDFVRKRRVDNETKAFLDKHGGWKTADPVDVKKLSHSPKIVWSNSPFRFLSWMGKQSVLASALPHLLNNMGTLTMWQGGMPALGRSAAYMVRGLDEAQIQRLKDMGAHSDYAHDFERILGANVPGVQNLLGASNAVLNRGELAMRQAILDELDKLHPSKIEEDGTRNAVDEFAKAQKVRDALGDYRNVSAFISLMDALGAPFAPFMGVFSKAARQTIGSDKAYRFVAPLRAQQDLDAQTEDSPQGQLQIPNPSEAYAKMLTGGGWLSPSRTGPIPSLLANIAGSKTGHPAMQNLWQFVAEQMNGYGGPLLSNLPGFLSMPFQSPGFDPGDFDWLGGMLHLFLGDYFKNPMSEKPDQAIQRAANRVSE